MLCVTAHNRAQRLTSSLVSKMVYERACARVRACAYVKEEKEGLKNFCKIETILKCYYLWTTVIKKSLQQNPTFMLFF